MICRRITLLLTCLLLPHIVCAKVIHEERSLYRNIIIDESNHQRCMRFVLRSTGTHNQSCMDLRNPNRLVFEYTQKVMLGLMLQKPPQKILVVGLGGGSLPMSLHQLLPHAEITSLEIDPAVVKAAKQYFGYQENTLIKTEIIDARVYIKRAVMQKKQWDFIILDAFNGDYIPEHLMTQEFLKEVNALLSKNGIVAANTFSTSRLYHHESTTYASVYPHMLTLKNMKGNRVIFAAQSPLIFPHSDSALARWQTEFAPFEIALLPLLADISEPDWDTSARVLTDQYAPANLLKH